MLSTIHSHGNTLNIISCNHEIESFAFLVLDSPIFDGSHAVLRESEAEFGLSLGVDGVAVLLDKGASVSRDNLVAGGTEHNSLGGCNRVIGEADV